MKNRKRLTGAIHLLLIALLLVAGAFYLYRPSRLIGDQQGSASISEPPIADSTDEAGLDQSLEPSNPATQDRDQTMDVMDQIEKAIREKLEQS